MQARLHPGRLAVHELATGRSWTYAEWDKAIAQTVTLLRDAHGIAVGDRVAAIGRNCAEHLLLHLACARLGAIYVPLNWRLAPAEADRLIADAEPALLVGDPDFLTPLADHSRIRDFAALRADIGQQAPAAGALIDRTLPSLILYTSGTSGTPKGAMLTEKAISQTAINFGTLAAVTRDSMFLAETPMFHVIGIITNVRPALMRGGAVLISDGFEPTRTLQRLADPAWPVTHYFCVPQMAKMLRTAPNFDARRLGRLTAVFSGGAPHPMADICAWLDDGIAIADGFGMSEAGTVSCMPLDQDLIRAKAGSVGIVPPAIETRIVDREGRDLPAGTPGDLLLKGENLFCGYWRQPELTRQAFTADGWFRTGDIARQDEDGFLYLVDRSKDMFISGGENVYPAEIEAALAAMPGLKECAVVGVADETWGEVGHLFAVPTGPAIDLTMIRSFLEGCIARYKIPKHVTVVDHLPRTASGKLLKAELKRLSRLTLENA
ncbi:4-coumarate--CoA ligase [Acidisoma sp. 7E03]